MSKDRGFNMHIIYKWLIVILLCGIETSVFAQVTAKFSSSKITSCGNTEIEFIDESTGSPTEWIWDFGNGVKRTESESKSYKFIYQPGTYTVSLKVSRGTQTDETSLQITINPLPNPDFEIKSFDGCTHSDVTFSDKTTSDSEIEKYLWAFGDGGSSMDANPVYQYNKGGIYSVSLTVTNKSGCKVTIKKDDVIEVTNKLNLSFIAETSEACHAPLTTKFTPILSEEVSSYHWNFGDGSDMDGQTPSHTYENDGLYSVTLSTQSKTGCLSTKTIDNYIKINATKISINTVDAVCVADSLSIVGSANRYVESWEWMMEDGNVVSNKSNFKYIYEKSGDFEIKLNVIDSLGCEVNVSKKISVNPLPDVDFTANRTHWCEEDVTMPIVFSSTIKDAQFYLWNFGDGDKVKNSNFEETHSYVDGTTFDVSLHIKDKNGCENGKMKAAFVTKSNPIVNFLVTDDYEKSHFCVNEPIYIENASSSTIEILDTKWEYLYDRSCETKNTVNVLEYNKAGEYPIRLTVTDVTGCVGVKEEVLTIGDGDLLTAEITSPKVLTYCPRELINFGAKSSGMESKWEWRFTNRTTGEAIDTILFSNSFQMSLDETAIYSILMIPYHYSCPGFFDSKKITINPPKADFEYYPLVSCTFPDTIHFDPSISIGAERYSWFFGDGEALDVIPTGESGHFKWINSKTNEVVIEDTLSNVPYHIYTSPGAYEVKLITYAGLCDDEITKTFNTSGIAIGFSCDTNRVCQGEEITFVDTSTIVSGTVKKRIWLFNDQKYETTNEAFTYVVENSGLYNVGLTIQTEAGCQQSFEKSSYVTVNQLPDVLSFETIGKQTGCVEHSVNFQVKSTSSAQKYIWDFGDGVIDTTTIFRSSVHKYGVGSYYASVKLVDANNCVQLSEVLPIKVTNPNSDFVLVRHICGGDGVKPINNSIGESLTYLWDWGDGTSSNEKNAGHIYSKTDAVRDVILKVVDENECESSKTQQVYVHQPQSKFSSTQTIYQCPPADVSFINESIGENLQFEWNIGDETAAPLTAYNAFWQYQTAGTYNISLIVTDEYGCVDTLTKEDYISVVGPVGKFKIEPEIGCLNSEFSLCVYDVASVAEYDWIFGDGQYGNTTDSSVTHKYDYFRTYTPMVILKDANGCELSLFCNPVKIVGTNAKPDFSINSDICFNKEIVPDDNSIGTTLTYLWDWGDGNVSEGKEAKHLYAPLDAIYNVTLQLVDENGCDTTKTVKTHVHRPMALFSSEQTVFDCPPAEVSFVNQSLGSDLQCQWVVADTILKDMSVSAIYDFAGDYDVKLLVTDEYNCVDSIEKPQYIHVGGPSGIFKVEPDSGCTYTDFSFVAYDTNNVVEYIWNFGDGQIITGIDAHKQYSYSQGNVYKPILTIIDEKGCEKVLSGNPITVSQVIPDFIGDTLLCGANNVTFLDNSIEKQGTIDSWSWIFKNGENIDKFNGKIVDKILDYGVYDVQLQTKVNGCVYTKEYTQYLKIYETPDVGFEIDENEIKMNDLVVFKNAIDTADSLKPTIWSWKIDDTYSTQDYDLSYSFSHPGTFDITLDGFIYEECKNSVTKPITVLYSARVPNVFTPNGDGVNDVFFEGMPEAELVIINRWGQELYRGYDGWDGTYNGEVMAAGTYFYIITLPNGESYNGPLMLLRN